MGQLLARLAFFLRDMGMKTSIPKLHSIKFKNGPFADNVAVPEGFQPPGNLPAMNILQGAILADLRDVVIIGYEQCGREYIASTMGNPKDAHYMLARGQMYMLRLADGCDDCGTDDEDPAA